MRNRGIDKLLELLRAAFGEVVVADRASTSVEARVAVEGLKTIEIRRRVTRDGLFASSTVVGIGDEPIPLFQHHPGSAPPLVPRFEPLLEVSVSPRVWSWTPGVVEEDLATEVRTAVTAQWRDFAQRLRDQWLSCPDAWLERTRTVVARQDFLRWLNGRWVFLPDRLSMPAEAKPTLYTSPEPFVHALLGFGPLAHVVLAGSTDAQIRSLQEAGARARRSGGEVQA